jgi:hypothetical protein
MGECQPLTNPRVGKPAWAKAGERRIVRTAPGIDKGRSPAKLGPRLFLPFLASEFPRKENTKLFGK